MHRPPAKPPPQRRRHCRRRWAIAVSVAVAVAVAVAIASPAAIAICDDRGRRLPSAIAIAFASASASGRCGSTVLIEATARAGLLLLLLRDDLKEVVEKLDVLVCLGSVSPHVGELKQRRDEGSARHRRLVGPNVCIPVVLRSSERLSLVVRQHECLLQPTFQRIELGLRQFVHLCPCVVCGTRRGENARLPPLLDLLE